MKLRFTRWARVKSSCAASGGATIRKRSRSWAGSSSNQTMPRSLNSRITSALGRGESLEVESIGGSDMRMACSPIIVGLPQLTRETGDAGLRRRDPAEHSLGGAGSVWKPSG